MSVIDQKKLQTYMLDNPIKDMDRVFKFISIYIDVTSVPETEYKNILFITLEVKKLLQTLLSVDQEQKPALLHT